MTWTWAINVVTVVCDLNKVGLKALIYILSSWCEMGWNLGFFLNEVVDKVSVTLFPRIIAIPQIITSLKHRPPPPHHPNPSCHFLFLLSCPCYYSAIIPENTVLYEIPGIFFNYIHTAGILYFFSPNSCIKITLFCNTTVYKLTQSSFILITQILYKHLLPKI